MELLLEMDTGAHESCHVGDLRLMQEDALVTRALQTWTGPGTVALRQRDDTEKKWVARNPLVTS